MSKIKQTESLRRRYWDYIDKNKHEKSLADLGFRHPSIIDLNIFAEILIENLIKARSAKNIAKVVAGDFFIEEIFLNHIKHTQFLRDGGVNKLFDELPQQSNFDLVFSSFPWSLKLRPTDDPNQKYSRYYFKNNEKFKDHVSSDGSSINTSFEFIRSLESMKMLSDDGIGICFLPSYFRTFELLKFREILNDNDLYIEAILKTPNGLLKGVTGIESIFLLVSRKRKDEEFIIDLESLDSLEKGLNSFNKKETADHIKEGIWVKSGSFEGFNNWNYQKELDEIAGDFATYSKYKISDLCTSINRAIGGKNPKPHSAVKNCIYLPFIGNKNAVISKNDLQIKEHNYYQLVVDQSLILPEYLASFFNSKLGKMLLDFNKAGTVIPTLSREKLNEMEIGVPSMEKQREIVSNIRRVNELKKQIENFANSLSINPLSDRNTLKQVDSMIEIISELSDADKCRSIIRRGEDICTEFKQTLSLDIAKQTKEKYITESALKTIAAFLNTKGGELLIGVDDEMNITGIDFELEKFHKKDPDKFLNNFKDLFKKHIGPEFYPFIEQRIIDLNEKKVFLVSCLPSDKEVFVDERDFYVRTTPATDKLEGRSQSDYIRTRFG